MHLTAGGFADLKEMMRDYFPTVEPHKFVLLNGFVGSQNWIGFRTVMNEMHALAHRRREAIGPRRTRDADERRSRGQDQWTEDWIGLRRFTHEFADRIMKELPDYLHSCPRERAQLDRLFKAGNVDEYRRLLDSLVGHVDEANIRPADQPSAAPKVSFNPELAKEVPRQKTGPPLGTPKPAPKPKGVVRPDDAALPKARTAAREKNLPEEKVEVEERGGEGDGGGADDEATDEEEDELEEGDCEAPTSGSGEWKPKRARPS
jgi:hypothetical protein